MYVVFADESGIGREADCYGIGCLALPEAELADFNKFFSERHTMHGVVGELKWTKIRNSHGMMNLTLDLLKRIIERKYRLGAIVVFKGSYRKWQEGNFEDAFYTTYNLLLTHLVKLKEGEYRVYIDDRSDAYDKQDEVVHVIGNRMLRKKGREGELIEVQKSDSRLRSGIQVVDVLTGAVVSAHNHALTPNMPIHPGKIVVIKRLAELLGLPGLETDTFPDSDINIWHFPQEHRAVFSKKAVVKPNLNVRYIRPEELGGQ